MGLPVRLQQEEQALHPLAGILISILFGWGLHDTSLEGNVSLFTYYYWKRNETAPCCESWYTKLLTSHPIKTKAITLGILNCIGDIFTQLFVEKASSLDLRRVASMTSLGLFIVGPTLHYWYAFLNRVVKTQGTKGVAIRLVLDQFVFAPTFIAITFAYLLLMEGNVDKIQDKLQKDWKPTLIANWKLWIPFQFCNFMFVPPILQVLFSNVVGLAWNVYISYASHKPAGQEVAFKRLATQIQNEVRAPLELPPPVQPIQEQAQQQPFLPEQPAQ